MNSMRYNLVFYEEEILFNFIMNLINSKGKNISAVKYAYILHDKDIEEDTGELKKPHYHLWLEFPSQVKSRDIENIITLSGGKITALSYDKTDRNFLAYLTHDNKNNQFKVRYSKNDIITNIEQEEFDYIYSLALEKMQKPSKAESTASIIRDIATIINDNPKIINFSALVYFCIEQELTDILDYLQKKPYFISSAFKNQFMTNSLNKCSHELNTEIKDKLDYAKEEWNTAKKESKYLNDVIEKMEKLEYNAFERERKKDEQ